MEPPATYLAMDTIFAVIGVSLILAAIFLFRSHAQWRASAQSCEGTITKVSASTDDGSTVYFPTVQFTAEGRIIEHTSKVGMNKRYTVGQSVTVYYQKGQPDRPQLAGLSVKVFAALSLSVVAIAALGWGFIKRQNEKTTRGVQELIEKKNQEGKK